MSLQEKGEKQKMAIQLIDVFSLIYGSFQRLQFLNYGVVKLGNDNCYGEYSEIRMGHGIKGVWSYALSYSYGTEGGRSALSVYDLKFPSRKATLTHALGKNEGINGC